MAACGLLVRMDVRLGRENEVEQLLRAVQAASQQETGTMAWFAIRYGKHEYGVCDVFPDEAARDAHLAGPTVRDVIDRSGELLMQPLRIRRFDVLAEKIGAGLVSKGLLLTFSAKSGHEQEVEQFLRDARSYVLQEQGTISWFAIKLEHGPYGIFDVFPDNGARFSHLTGHVPRELAKHALTLLGSVPDLNLVDVLVAKE